MSADPDEGPLSEFEEAALRRALMRDDGPIKERAALWLALAFGANPANLSLLRENDFEAYNFTDDVAPAFFINMPRIKKRMPPRCDFKKRNVDAPLARIIEELIAYNNGTFDGHVRPLFLRDSPRQMLVGGPLDEYAYHHTAYEITHLIARAVQRLQVESPRTGNSLEITTRRLRYSYATRMVRQGIPARELAELLDHTDTQNVQVYYKADSRFVERLDATIAENLGPRVRAFMGDIKPRDGAVIDLIPFRNLPELGFCGASFRCGLAPHKTCYTCTKFNAFPDGAHTAVLDALLEERREYLESGHERIAEQLDETILAVGEVIARSEGVA
ncbi:MAG: tyrosine-type recombinase/integrase [Vulcanimicrobiaceae bacterium]